MLDRLSLKLVVAIAIAGSAGALAAGLLLDVGSFVENLLAELIGVFLSIALAVLVVDKVVERERERRWDLVSVPIIHTLRFALMRTGMEAFLRLPPPRPPNADPYTLGVLAPDRLAGALEKLALKVREEKPGFTDEGELVDRIRPHLELIRSAAMPQLLAIGRRDLLAPLAIVDKTFQDLEHTVWIEQRMGSLNDFNGSLGQLLDATAEVVKAVDAEAA